MTWTQQQFCKFSKLKHEQAHQITVIKNSDYSPGNNPFSNFEKLGNVFGKDFPLKMMIARLQEKCDRIANYALMGKNPANDEPLENDFIDVGNYAIMCLAYILSCKDSQGVMKNEHRSVNRGRNKRFGANARNQRKRNHKN